MSVITSTDINGGKKIYGLIFSNAVKANKKTQNNTIECAADPEHQGS